MLPGAFPGGSRTPAEIPEFVQVLLFLQPRAAGSPWWQDFTGSEEGRPDGAYAFTGLPPGNYTVHFNNDGWGPWYQGKTSEATANLVVVTAGETTAGVNDDLTSILSVVTTAPVTEVGITSVTSGGSVSVPQVGSVVARGVCWGTSSNPTIVNAKTTDGSGAG